MGVIGGGISMNGPSGIDTASLVDQLTALEQQKVTGIEDEKKKYQVKIDAYSKMRSVLATLSTTASALNSASSFDIFKSVSSNEDAVTLKGDVGAVEAIYDVGVYQIASNEKMISADKKITDQTKSLSSLGITTGDISIDGTTITIDSGDTIQDMRMKINNATDNNGNRLNVSASVLKVSDSDFRLVLTSKKTGSAGVAYEGDTLVSLGILTASSTSGGTVDNKGNIAQVLQSQDDIQTAFNGLAAGATIELSGTDRSGNQISNTFVKPDAATSIDDFVAQVKSSFHDMVDVAIDGSGKLIITDKVKGASQLSISSLSIGATAYAMTTTTVGQKGAGVLSGGKDAYFSVDGVSLVSSDNEAEGFIPGVTVELHKTSEDETAQVSLTRDTDAIKKKVQEMVDAYNAVLKFVGDNTKMANPSDRNSTAGDLAGDMTAKSILDQTRNELMKSMTYFGGSYNSLTMYGIKSDSQTGVMSLDEKQFSKALTNNFDEVVKFFTTTGISDNKSINLGRKTKDTQSGSYTIREIDADHFEIQSGTDPAWYASDARSGDIVSFSSGPAKGLSLTAPAGTIGSGTAKFTFVKGLGDRITELVNRMSDPQNGMITLHQNSLTGSIDSANDRIDVMQKRVDHYHDRLVKQFSAMEEAMQKMRSQMSNMLSALGMSTS
jgi:flagellar capping protein FliD